MVRAHLHRLCRLFKAIQYNVPLQVVMEAPAPNQGGQCAQPSQLPTESACQQMGSGQQLAAGMHAAVDATPPMAAPTPSGCWQQPVGMYDPAWDAQGQQMQSYVPAQLPAVVAAAAAVASGNPAAWQTHMSAGQAVLVPAAGAAPYQAGMLQQPAVAAQWQAPMPVEAAPGGSGYGALLPEQVAGASHVSYWDPTAVQMGQTQHSFSSAAGMGGPAPGMAAYAPSPHVEPAGSIAVLPVMAAQQPAWVNLVAGGCAPHPGAGQPPAGGMWQQQQQQVFEVPSPDILDDIMAMLAD
jgi:hypothetical protein